MPRRPATFSLVSSFTYNQHTRLKVPLGKRLDIFDDYNLRKDFDAQWDGAEGVEPVPADTFGRWESEKASRVDGNLWDYTQELTRFRVFAPLVQHHLKAQSQHSRRFHKAGWIPPSDEPDMDMYDCLEDDDFIEIDEVQDAAKSRKPKKYKDWEYK